MARIRVQSPAEEGETIERNQDVNGANLVWTGGARHKYSNTGLEFLRIQKGAGAAVMTLHTQVPAGETYNLQLPDKTVNIAAGSTKIYGPYSPGAFNEREGGDDPGHTGISFSEVTGLMVEVIRAPRVK